MSANKSNPSYLEKCLRVLPLIVSIEVAYADNNTSCDKTPTMSELATVDDSLKIFDTPVLIATHKATCSKQAASSVTVISGEEILNMGARDLIDVLRLVPGFEFGVDVSNIVGLGIRGFQAHEGKVSVFIDGINITEHRYGTTLFGGHFPVDNIDRIEIIRGPGSIVHGNFAEMGVINIITKTGSQIDGTKVSGNYGHFENGEARQNINVAAGKKWDDFEVSFIGKHSYTHRSDRIYADSRGREFDMAKANELESTLGNLNIKYKDFSLRLLADRYTVNTFDRIAFIGRTNVINQFNTYAVDLNYAHNFSDYFKLEAQGYASRQNVWERTMFNPDNTTWIGERVYADYYRFNLKSTFASNDGDYLVLGGSYTQDKFSPKMTEAETNNLPVFENYTLYTEGLYKTDWVDILAALRFDYYNVYGTNLAPRVALTKSFDKFHFKALYSHAFRIPTGANYQLNQEYNKINKLGKQIEQVHPERTRTAEIELGYNLLENLNLSVDLFHIESNDIILYQVDKDTNDYYINGKALSTQGVEAGLHYKNKDWGYFDLNYSYYQSIRNTAENYQILTPQGQIHKSMNLGFPSHKVTANALLQLTPNFSINQTMIFISDRYGYSGSELIRHQPSWIYNLYFRYQNLFTKGLDVGLGIYDVFNQKHDYVQPYNGKHPALPGPTRELLLNISYQF